MIEKANLEKKEKGTYISVPLVPRVETKRGSIKTKLLLDPREILNYSGKRGRYTRFYMRVGTLRDTVTKPIGKAETKVNIVTKVKNKIERKFGVWLVSFT